LEGNKKLKNIPDMPVRLNKLSEVTALFLFVIVDIATVGTEKETYSGYNLSKPDEYHILPDILYEVSGLTCLGSNSFACIQDENGILFIYDAALNKITKQFHFSADGDYEGITRAGKTIYVLRSDGVLFEISDYTTPSFRLNIYYTGIPSWNNEGVCYDRDNNRLLIACKGRTAKGSEFRDIREVYGFDLTTKTLSGRPVFEFDINEIKKFAISNKIKLPLIKTGKGKPPEPLLKFETSDLCIHPVTKKLFVIAKSDYMLLIFNMKGGIEDIELLDRDLFPNAEGIAFFDNGDMMITNEGQNKSATVLRFDYHKKK